MHDTTMRSGLTVNSRLASFVEQHLLADLGIDATAWWSGLAAIYRNFTLENHALLDRRDALQAEIDARYLSRKPVDESFLRQIGYLEPEPAPFVVATTGVDQEVKSVAAPQLVVPALNARFALNAANARWGSLYDALYGTDALAGAKGSNTYDRVRGRRVVARAKKFLDAAVPLAKGSWAEWRGDGPVLRNPRQLAGRCGDTLLFRHHGLHIELVIDPDHPVGREDPAGIADVILESALTTIVDLEDSVAAVDADDKIAAYGTWLGLMRGDLTDTFDKSGATITRRLAADRRYTAPDGSAFSLPGRSLLFIRNVGHLMTTPAIVLDDQTEAPEGILDAVVTATTALHDLRRSGRFRNSSTGSVYIVKPKMHGPQECAFTDRLFDAVEDLLRLPRYTLKVGVMDEERRTSANLAACIHAVRNRIVFINTGFLDRTGDEIRTNTHAGPMLPKDNLRQAPWIKAYERRNVRIGLAHGLSGRGQIGKGMWAAPDRMADMLESKIAHPQAGATTAWVPSPTAATLHVLHYHQIDVFARQKEILSEGIPPLADLLTLPVADGFPWSSERITRELENNAQSILGYVVRWVDQGVGCSKVPDIDDLGLMEDRATLRISSQAISNWLIHSVVSPEQVDAALRRMAARVDRQNAGDPSYRPMSGFEERSLSFQGARSLIFDGHRQSNGYTEPLLHAYRKRAKALHHD